MNKVIRKFKGRNRYSGVRLIFSSTFFVLVLLPAIFIMYDSGFEIQTVILCSFSSFLAFIPLILCLIFTFLKWNPSISINDKEIKQREFGLIKRLSLSDIKKIDYQYNSFFGKCYLSIVLMIGNDERIIIETKSKCFRFLIDECFDKETRENVEMFLF